MWFSFIYRGYAGGGGTCVEDSNTSISISVEIILSYNMFPR
jgi:hypothetical protein